MYDAMYAFAYGLDEMLVHNRMSMVNISCDGDQAWAFGSTLHSYINMVWMLLFRHFVQFIFSSNDETMLMFIKFHWNGVQIKSNQIKLHLLHKKTQNEKQNRYQIWKN